MSPQEFERRVRQGADFLANGIFVVVGVEATRHFKQSFHNEGFTDKTLEKWNDTSPARKEQKRRRNGALPPILTDTGDLGDSITWHKEGNSVILASDLPYAERHNEGTDGMPQRQFMGESEVLMNAIDEKITRTLNSIFG